MAPNSCIFVAEFRLELILQTTSFQTQSYSSTQRSPYQYLRKCKKETIPKHFHPFLGLLRMTSYLILRMVQDDSLPLLLPPPHLVNQELLLHSQNNACEILWTW